MTPPSPPASTCARCWRRERPVCQRRARSLRDAVCCRRTNRRRLTSGARSTGTRQRAESSGGGAGSSRLRALPTWCDGNRCKAATAHAPRLRSCPARACTPCSRPNAPRRPHSHDGVLSLCPSARDLHYFSSQRCAPPRWSVAGRGQPPGAWHRPRPAPARVALGLVGRGSFPCGGTFAVARGVRSAAFALRRPWVHGASVRFLCAGNGLAVLRALRASVRLARRDQTLAETRGSDTRVLDASSHACGRACRRHGPSVSVVLAQRGHRRHAAV